jgi:hypothetical protein
MSTPELIVSKDGTKRWYFNGDLHRTDGPSVEYATGTKMWYVNGKLHREDGPAVEWANGDKEWWLNGHQYDTFDEYAKAAKWTDDQLVEWKLTQ